MSSYIALFEDEIRKLSHRPRLLFHACCGVCCVYPLLLLDDYFDVTIYYTNDNIYPEEEYDLRLRELERYLSIISYRNIGLVVPERNSPVFLRKLEPMAAEKEGGRRCFSCYEMRIEESFRYAHEEGYEYCGTVMSVSGRKNADYINRIGSECAARYAPVKFLTADFKKKGGQALNEKLNKELDLYHQVYCGCPFSMR
jgi:predicted adenine nucleotide alpha hydrolase (AANH) superfamily ATPase